MEKFGTIYGGNWDKLWKNLGQYMEEIGTNYGKIWDKKINYGGNWDKIKKSEQQLWRKLGQKGTLFDKIEQGFAFNYGIK